MKVKMAQTVEDANYHLQQDDEGKVAIDPTGGTPRTTFRKDKLVGGETYDLPAFQAANLIRLGYAEEVTS